MEKLYNSLSTIIGVVGIFSFLWSIFQYYYYNKLKFYVFFNRFFNRNKTIWLEVFFTYKVEKELLFYKELESIFKELYGRVPPKEINLDNNKMYNARDYVIKVQEDELINSTETLKEIFISFPRIRITLSEAITVIESIEKLDEKIRFKNIIQKAEYSVNVIYSQVKDNPFIHTIVRHFGENNIVNFTCNVDGNILNEKISKNKITISKDKIYVNRDNFSEIRKIIPYILLIREVK